MDNATPRAPVGRPSRGHRKSDPSSLVESTLFYLPVNYREMISCIVSTWIIVRSCSKYKLDNR